MKKMVRLLLPIMVVMMLYLLAKTIYAPIGKNDIVVNTTNAEQEALKEKYTKMHEENLQKYKEMNKVEIEKIREKIDNEWKNDSIIKK